MAVFICAADESADEDYFFYGGFSAPIEVWEGCFADAWNQRVLGGWPKLPYLHMTDIRDWEWQKKFGLQPWTADRRLDAAAEVIRSTGSPVPVIVFAQRPLHEQVVRRPFKPEPNRKDAQLDPDYLCFLWFAMAQLELLHAEFGDAVERVDFRVERNGPVTRRLEGFHRSLVSALEYIDKARLIPLVGDFACVDKGNVAGQAADMLTWHARNRQREKLDRPGRDRYWKMIVGGRGSNGRVGHRIEMHAAAMQQLSEAFDKYPSAVTRPPYDTGETAR